MSRDALRPAVSAALDAWAARVRANREQVDRVREVEDGDFYAPLATLFRYEPERPDEAVLAVLRSMVRPGEDVLDVGCGGGRYALPLAALAHRVTCVDPSLAMLRVLRAGIAELHVSNLEVMEARWPIAGVAPQADVALMANVGNDIEDIGGFLDALERSARRLCIAVLLETPPPAAFDALWPEVHGETRASLPALPELLALQLARGRLCEVRLLEHRAERIDPDALLRRARRQLWVREGEAKDDALRQLLGREGITPGLRRVGIVSWDTSIRS